ncbi:DNA-binding response regulator in two-component regulatory system with KdpD [Candidatus Hydrogenisulfobacillus filiaventi]|uniref:Stage 0 sporulation protein A homolog n=1 Tax=Candidatus Hydrogenisulfobacillus filiaventi TaxID=2707344 RepID=A0A6F8ZFU5_9FIRM|nr:response regulator transcription factor [Bacillota bacterium]CAB1128751.1 DNA-binding response regulator in two-component regulatory system with KdpD [Candidatus Hydrogenisulfobacillus filiaventi]
MVREGELILVVEDEPKYRRLLAVNLKLAGFRVAEAADGAAALRFLFEAEPDLILLDLLLPDRDGFSLLERVRAFTRAPVIMVTALDRKDDIIRGLNEGADDYVTKPFSPEEVVARIRAVLRRGRDPGPAPARILECGPLRLDGDRRRLEVAGREGVSLTPTEWRMLAELMRHCGRVLTHEQLLQRVWGPEYRDDLEYLRVYVRRLRGVVEPDPRHPQYLITVAGVGYVLYPAPHGAAGREGR